MKTLAKYDVCNHCVIGEKTFKNILIGPAKLLGLSRNGPTDPVKHELVLEPKVNQIILFFVVIVAVVVLGH